MRTVHALIAVVGADRTRFFDVRSSATLRDPVPP